MLSQIFKYRRAEQSTRVHAHIVFKGHSTFRTKLLMYGHAIKGGDYRCTVNQRVTQSTFAWGRATDVRSGNHVVELEVTNGGLLSLPEGEDT